MSAGRNSSPARPGRAPFGVVSTLTFSLIAGSLLIVMPLVILNTSPTVVGNELAEHKQDAESLVYLLAFAIILPFWLWIGPRVADRIQAGPNGGALAALTAGLAALLGLVVIGIRVSGELPWGDGLGVTLAGGLAWAAIAAATLARAARPSSWAPLARIEPHTDSAWWAAGGLLALAAATVTRFGHVNLPTMLIGLAVVAAVVWGYGRFRFPVVSKGWRRALDALVIVLILLAVPDMIILPVERIATDGEAGFLVYIIQFHQALFLGAASQVQGGSALLVDTVSQYGILPIYLLAALFEFIPIGNGTLGFIDGSLSAVVFAAGFAILRMAGVRFGLAFAALVVGVVAFVYGLTYPIGGLLQHGALRFGLPVLVIAPLVAGFRWPAIERPAKLFGLLIVGLSSVWALESFLYVTFSYLGIVAIQIAWREPGERLGWLIRRMIEMIAAWVAVQVVFALATLAAAGSLPDWGLYLSYLRDFLAGDVGDLTYDFSPWSRGLALAAVYLASVVGLAVLATRLPTYAAARKPALVALAGLTAYGIALFSYFDNRSLDHILPYVSLPALLAVTIWLALLLEPGGPAPVAIRRFGLGVAALAAALLVAVAVPAAGSRFQDSLLAYTIPGGPSLSSGFERLWHPPAFKPSALDGERLVDRYMSDQDEIAVIAEPDLDVEIVTRTDRPNALGITDAKEMSWVFGPHREQVDENADRMEAGDLILLDPLAIEAFGYAEANPAEAPELAGLESKMELVQRRILSRLSGRFRLKPVATSESGLTVFRLEDRRP